MGQTAKFWLQYFDFIWNILHLLRATKTNDLDLHITSLEKMCPIFFSMDQQNYARYLTVYIILLLNLDVSHPGAKDLLKEKGFSVCRSTVPASRVAVDITIEQTINRQAKSRGGIIGFSQNQSAYQRWCITRHKRAAFVSMLQEQIGLDPREDAHKDNQRSQMKKSEKYVNQVIQSFKSFADPFEMPASSSLISLSSGLQATDQVEKDLLTVQLEGSCQYQKFIQERLVEKTTSFHAPIKRNRKQTFGSLSKTVLLKTSKKQEVKITAQRNIFSQLLILSQDNNIDLQKVMEYPLGPVPWSLATADGMPIKTDKAALMHKLEEEDSYKAPDKESNHIHIIDGNALFHSLSQIPETFGEVAQKIFNSLPKVKRVHFLTDNYKDVSIKSAERLRRGDSHQYTIAGPSMTTPKVWKQFLKNEDNKKQLIQFLLTEWQKDTYANLLHNREIFFASEYSCVILTSPDGQVTESQPVINLSTTQEEEDTLIILHSIYADTEAGQEDVDIIVRSPDTDVLILLLSFCQRFNHPLYFDTGNSNKRRMIHIQTLSEKIKREIQESILGLHAFTGCDSISAFVQKGKKRPLKVLYKYLEFVSAFKELGKEEIVSERCLLQLEKFVCHLYGKPNHTSVNKLRYDLVRQKYHLKGKCPLSSIQGLDISLLPPCQQALRMHIMRANYQAMIWRQAYIALPDIPQPSGYGWTLGANGVLSIDWCTHLVPQQLVDILHDNKMSIDDDNEIDDTPTDNDDIEMSTADEDGDEIENEFEEDFFDESDYASSDEDE